MRPKTSWLRLLVGVLAMALLVSTAPPAARAAAITVSGTVMNDQNDAVAGAVVEALDSSTGQTVASAMAGADGQYALLVEPGTYDLRATPPPGSPYASSSTPNRSLLTNTTIDFILVGQQNMATQSGRLLNPLGEPLVGLQIDLKSSSGVTDTAGNPVPGALVTNESHGIALNAADFGATSATGISSYSLTQNQVNKLVTDAADRATLWLFPMPAYLFALTVTPPPGADLATGGLRTAFICDTALTLVLKPAVTISGRMVNGLGEPMVNQEVGFSGLGH